MYSAKLKTKSITAEFLLSNIEWFTTKNKGIVFLTTSGNRYEIDKMTLSTFKKSFKKVVQDEI